MDKSEDTKHKKCKYLSISNLLPAQAGHNVHALFDQLF